MLSTIDMTLSPLDRAGARDEPTTSGPAQPDLCKLVPSRYNARTVDEEDGRVILWNTFTGAINAFESAQREAVLRRLAPSGWTGPRDRVVEYLAKRGYLVPEGTNELDAFRLSYARQQWRTDVLELTLLASEDCNFRCVYCYEQFKRGTMRPDVRLGVRSLIAGRARYLRELRLEWFGGEPLYGWDAIADIAPFVKQVIDDHGLVGGQTMTTNGYLLTEERATKLLEWGCRGYQITVDGLPAEHDCKRVGRDGSPTYDVIMDNLRSLKARKDRFIVAIRVNYDQLNAPKLLPFLDTLAEDFADDPRFVLRFRAVGKWGGENDANLSTCGVGEQRAMIDQLRTKADDVRLHQEAGITVASEFGSQVCYAARPYHLIVGANGAIMKCTVALDKVPENIVGHLEPDGTFEMNDAHMAKWVNPHFETDTMCQKCYVLPTCQGAQCPLSRVMYGTRTCCAVKSELKTEMRYTLRRAPRRHTSLATA